jgi:hypothetical protein
MLSKRTCSDSTWPGLLRAGTMQPARPLLAHTGWLSVQCPQGVAQQQGRRIPGEGRLPLDGAPCSHYRVNTCPSVIECMLLPPFLTTIQAVGCDGEQEPLSEQVAAALAQPVRVLLVCPGSAAGSLDDEMQALVSTVAAVTTSLGDSKRVVYLYGGVAAAAGEDREQRAAAGRRLQQAPAPAAPNTTYSGFGQYTKCGELCWVCVCVCVSYARSC